MTGTKANVKIKICGIRTPAEAGYLNDAKADYAGCVFYEPSKRFVTDDQAEKILKALDANIGRVAVTVSPTADDVRRIESLGFDILQVHKDLSLEVLDKVSIPVWYAVNIADASKYEEAVRFIDELPKELAAKIEGILADAPDFGSGRTFDWKECSRIGTGDRLFILAGGLRSENVAEGIRVFEPDIVDVSSAVEKDNGKDRELIDEFVRAVRKEQG